VIEGVGDAGGLLSWEQRHDGNDSGGERGEDVENPDAVMVPRLALGGRVVYHHELSGGWIIGWAAKFTGGRTVSVDRARRSNRICLQLPLVLVYIGIVL
jgi:hypothetical protein